MSSNEYTIEDNDEVVDAQGGPKPHVVFRLDISPSIKAMGTTWMGCRLAMDLEGGYEGIFHITPLKYISSSHAAHAAFEFPLKRTDWTVNNVIFTIQNEPNLLNFSFKGGFKQPGSNIEYVGGCRDFISQFFIILHQWGLVGWYVHNIERGNFNSENFRVEVGKTGFHNIIGHNYTINPEGFTRVVKLPVARGTFWDERFRRVLSYQLVGADLCQLPYRPERGDDDTQLPH